MKIALLLILPVLCCAANPKQQYKPNAAKNYMEDIVKTLNDTIGKLSLQIMNYKETMNNILSSTIYERMDAKVFKHLPFDKFNNAAREKNSMHCYVNIEEKMLAALRHLKIVTDVCQKEGLSSANFGMMKLGDAYIRGREIKLKLFLERKCSTQDKNEMSYYNSYGDDLKKKTLKIRYNANKAINELKEDTQHIVEMVKTCVDGEIAVFWKQGETWNQDFNTCVSQHKPQRTTSEFPPLIHSH